MSRYAAARIRAIAVPAAVVVAPAVVVVAAIVATVVIVLGLAALVGLIDDGLKGRGFAYEYKSPGVYHLTRGSGSKRDPQPCSPRIPA